MPSPAHLVRRSLLLLSLALAACGGESTGATGSTSGSGGSGGGVAPAPEIGAKEIFTTLPSSSEGLAIAPGPDDQPTLYVGSDHKILRVARDGTITEHVALRGPLGIAVRGDGDLLVCGKTDEDSDMPGVIYRVTRKGEKSVFVGPGDISFGLTNFLAVAPDDSIVFSDSKANKLYRAGADGSNVELITDAISYPNGLAFSKDGKTLFVASWDSKKVYSFARSGDGSYGAPEVFTEDVENVDGISVFASGDLLFVASGEGLVRYGLDKKKTVLLPGTPLGLPANATFGAGDYGEGWVYVTNLIGQQLWRVYVGEGGAPMPVR